MAITAGLVLVARCAKSSMEDSEYFRSQDRECNMLFGAVTDSDQASKFSIDMAAAAHRNRVRAS